MEICSVCGQENTNNSRFCQECGNLYPSKANEELTNNRIEKPVEQSVVPKTRSIKNKRNKWVFAIITTITILLIGAHLFIKQSIDPYKQLSKADRAFVAKNSEEFLSYFSIHEDIITDHESFYEFMKEEEWTKSVSPTIKEMIRSIEKGQYSDPIQDQEGNSLISVVDEKFLLFYKKIKVQVEPIEVVAFSTVPNTEVTLLNDETITLKNDDNTLLGRFTPGTYKFNVLVKDDLSEQIREVSEKIVGDGNNKHNLLLDFSDQTIHVTSDYEDAIIWIDGKSTKKTAEELKLYNIPIDGSVKIQAIATMDGKEKKSETVAIEDTNVYLAFADVQAKIKAEQDAQEKKQAMEDLAYEYEESARQLFYNFRSDYYYAVSYGDFSYVSDYFADGTKLKDEYRKFVLGHNDFDFGYTYNFISNDISSVEIVNENTFNLFSYEVFDFYTSTEDNWNYERQKKYTIKLINNQLKITDLGDSEKVKKTKITY
ncbi:MAG: hypothetical protein RR651_11660 [Lysinibacillus sp.]